MKKILAKIFKASLILAVFLLILLLVFGLVLMLGWPLWLGFFILTGLGGVFLGIIFIRKILLRRREQNFVQQVINQDDTYIKGQEEIEKKKSKELQDRWKEAMEALRKSHLKKIGNPLYVLPWYLIIGESASGKTTAIKSARLSSPFAELSRTSGISGTRNCDWWFFEQAIILDTAGRYAIPVDEGRDKEEWQKFLSLLIRFRKKEPINGLVVTVPADKLIDPNMEVLEDDGKNIRKRIDELMRALGSKFPIYILVTKCDLIQGMTQFCDNLQEKNLEQAMGFLNNEMSRDVMGFHERAVRIISDRLRDLRLLTFQNTGSRIDPELLLFPEEFERIKPGLDAFIKAAFLENPYQETPILRGIFYSSGRQEGTPFSHFMSSLGLIEQREVLPGTNKGFFLKDFFSKILPKDRRLFSPTQRNLAWGRLTRNLGLTSWLAITIALCGLLSFSFVKNLSTLKDTAAEFTPPPVLRGEIFTDLTTMNRFKNGILNIEDRNNRWWVPRFWLTESMEVEKELKKKYCDLFRDGFLESFDKHMSDRFAGFAEATSDSEIGRHVTHLVRRINLLKARLEGKSFESLGNKPQPSFDQVVIAADQQIFTQLSDRFHGLYLYSLVWRDDTSRLNQEMNILQNWLKYLLDLRPNDMRWLAAWMNEETEISDIHQQDFWGGTFSHTQKHQSLSEQSLESITEKKDIDQGLMVHRAFTSDGKKMIESFIQEIENALDDPILIAGRKTDFKQWYRQAYLNEWYQFGVKFPEGVNHLDEKKEWQQMASVMATDNSPYFVLLDVMAEELDPFYEDFIRDENTPLWVGLVFEFQIVRSQIEDSTEKTAWSVKDTGIARKATRKLQSTVGRLQRETGFRGLHGEGELSASRRVTAKAFEQYQDALDKIAPIASSRQLAFQLIGVVFGEDPVISNSPFYLARNEIQNMKKAMAGVGTEQRMFWELVEGPWNFLFEYGIQETSCHIRKLWEEGVLVEVQGVSDTSNIANLLLGQDGLVTKFINGPAKPFVGRGVDKGYHSKEVLGKRIPFEGSFFSFMTQGTLVVQDRRAEPEQRVQANYSVNIRGLPTDANPEARIRPHGTNLDVMCANQTFNMLNLNYPVQKTIDWSPDTCGDVIFSITVGNLTLTKKYPGKEAFPRFLQDFSRGVRTFTPGDFPENRAELEGFGITYIRVHYQFSNHEPVLSLLIREVSRPSMPRLPTNITKCWDR